MDGVHKEELRQSIKRHTQATVSLSDDLAKNPEIAEKEFESSRKMVEMLRHEGFTVEYPFCGLETAFCAEFKNGDGPSVAVLVEYDALPGIGHACGHNLHGSISILAGLALKDLKNQFKGTLYVIGTPAEEAAGGKIPMCDAGVFDKMDFAIMFHSYNAGRCEPSAKFLGLRCYRFNFMGQTAHAAASPWEGRNALAAGRKFIDLIDARRQCFHRDAVINYIITDGGKAPNIIPNTSEIMVEFRAESVGVIETIADGILKCAQGSAIAFDCEYKWERDCFDFADIVGNQVAESEMSTILENLGYTVSREFACLGSSDIGNVSYRCPALHPMIPITDKTCALHTVEFASETTTPQAHEALTKGATAITEFVLKVYNDDSFRKSVRSEFERQLALKTGK